jgi:hypothetical protein
MISPVGLSEKPSSKNLLNFDDRKKRFMFFPQFFQLSPQLVHIFLFRSIPTDVRLPSEEVRDVSFWGEGLWGRKIGKTWRSFLGDDHVLIDCDCIS